MNDELDQDPLIRRLAATLFPPAAAADPRSTEAFVARVMARVEADSVPFWEKFAGRVLAPALAVAVAALLFAITVPSYDDDGPLDVAMAVDSDVILGVAP
ncbi:MAG: hypothetical protein HY923_06870 [Elusimicrobia bacterium]|nr:hypothetical protein [Elusimicrobiota bacterium]